MSLKDSGLHLPKGKQQYGQHFLSDPNYARKVLEAIDQDLKNVNCLFEVGPGKGVLTTHFQNLPTIDFYPVEIDQPMVDYLTHHCPTIADQIIKADFLKLGITQTCPNRQIGIIGNFPYNISSQIVFKVLNNRSAVELMTGMFQKEVGERIAAQPGSKTYGILSVLTQAFYEVKLLFKVPPGAFAPPPKVWSVVIKMRKKATEPFIQDTDVFFDVVKTAFNQRRKMLRNALKKYEAGFAQINPKLLHLRAEQLRVEDFVEFSNQVATS